MSDTTPTLHPLDQLAELALGILDGRERAAVLEHLEGCPSCLSEFEQLLVSSNALLSAVPEAEPPLGFEVRVLEALSLANHDVARRPVVRRSWLAAAAVLLVVVGLAFGILIRVPGSSPAAAPTPPSVRVAELTRAGHPLGVALAYGGSSGWLLVAVDKSGVNGEVHCVVETTGGHQADLGQFWLTHGSGSWSVRLPVGSSELRSAVLTDSGGQVVASAVFSS